MRFQIRVGLFLHFKKGNQREMKSVFLVSKFYNGAKPNMRESQKYCLVNRHEKICVQKEIDTITRSRY